MIIAAAQASPLFGVAYDSASDQFADYKQNGVNPFTNLVDPKGFLRVFDNSNGEFDELREKLFAANGSGAGTTPAFHQQTLQVIGNTVGGDEPRSKPVTVLWVQNAEVNQQRSQREQQRQ